jgi:hypothetical protein
MTAGTFLTSRRVAFLAGVVILLAAFGAYRGSLRGPFVFDDRPAIEENATIRHFTSAWWPPAGALPVSGRPVVNLTLALNYAISGDRVWSYHALNLLIHLAAGLTLYGLVRRDAAARNGGAGWRGRHGRRSGALCRHGGAALDGPSASDRVRDLHLPACGVPHGIILSADPVWPWRA